jgi:hypothetical protein
MSENLNLYNSLKEVPGNAKKPIEAGRLKGKTDINPMWRIKALTEQFGPCGIGWKVEILEERLEPAPNGEIAAFVKINLYFKHNNEWSEAIPGTGGSSFVANEKNGPYVSDECFKMAYTDAISVACKMIGAGASVYWEADQTKYATKEDDKPKQPQQLPKNTLPTDFAPICKKCSVEITQEVHDYSVKQFKAPLCRTCQKAVKDAKLQNGFKQVVGQ